MYNLTIEITKFQLEIEFLDTINKSKTNSWFVTHGIKRWLKGEYTVYSWN